MVKPCPRDSGIIFVIHAQPEARIHLLPQRLHEIVPMLRRVELSPCDLGDKLEELPRPLPQSLFVTSRPQRSVEFAVVDPVSELGEPGCRRVLIVHPCEHAMAYRSAWCLMSLVVESGNWICVLIERLRMGTGSHGDWDR